MKSILKASKNTRSLIQPHVYCSNPDTHQLLHPLLLLIGILRVAKKQSDRVTRIDLDEVRLAAGVMLRLGTDLNVRRLIDDLLHSILDELVEGVQLLPHKTLLLEVGADHRPGVLLGDLVVLVVVHHCIVVLHIAVRSRLEGGFRDHSLTGGREEI